MSHHLSQLTNLGTEPNTTPEWIENGQDMTLAYIIALYCKQY